jgi:acetyltransferase-like isoleucine patch superfamily enzyme
VDHQASSPPSSLTIEPSAWPGLGALRWRAGMTIRHEGGRLPWVRALLFVALLRRGVYIRRPFHGNAHLMLRQGRLEIGRETFLEAGVTLQSSEGRIRLGRRVYLSRGVTVGAVGLVEIGDYALVGPGCYITDADHRFSDPVVPVPDQGMTSKGPTILEDNVWLGANVVVTSGVRIGRHSVIAANSVVTKGIPEFSLAAGVPARAVSDTLRAGAPPQQLIDLAGGEELLNPAEPDESR